MSKKIYGVIGHPIGHTMSPFIHKKLFELSGIDAEYKVFDIPAEQLEEATKTTLSNLCGYNVTIPHKTSIIPFLGKTDKHSMFYGSVNTVKDNEGYTTDGYGFSRSLELANIPLKHRVVVLGVGGVSRIMAYNAVISGCDVTLAARPSDLSEAATLAGEIRDKIPHSSVNTSYIESLSGRIDLLINGTPVGMYPDFDTCPVSDDIIKSCHYVFDAVYNPLETTLIKTAKAYGKKTLGGMAMLVLQAVKAHEIWDGSTYEDADILNLIEESKKELSKAFSLK